MYRLSFQVQDLPFSSVEMSAYGRFGGSEGLRSLTSTTVIVIVIDR